MAALREHYQWNIYISLFQRWDL